MGSVWLAVIYIGGWILSMRIFGFFWRRRNLAINDAESWFGEHVPRDQYIALLQQSEPEATETQLMAALLRRAMEDVTRVLAMREDKPALVSLIKQGTVGDDILNQFALAEKEMESEIMAVIAEANTFKEGWGNTILNSASEMLAHERTKKLQQELTLKREEEARKQVIREQRKEELESVKAKKRNSTIAKSPQASPAAAPPVEEIAAN
ncbi:translocation protein S66 [Mortierella sp. GBA43]|nr:translocation protein S66 [Mortierella sp. GBA43]